MSARYVQFSASRDPSSSSTSRECRTRSAPPSCAARSSRDDTGRIAELDARQHPRAEERPRERARRNADVLRHAGSRPAEAARARAARRSPSGCRGGPPRGAGSGTPTPHRPRRRCCPSPRRAAGPAGPPARGTARRGAARPARDPRRSRDPSQARAQLIDGRRSFRRPPRSRAPEAVDVDPGIELAEIRSGRRTHRRGPPPRARASSPRAGLGMAHVPRGISRRAADRRAHAAGRHERRERGPAREAAAAARDPS